MCIPWLNATEQLELLEAVLFTSGRAYTLKPAGYWCTIEFSLTLSHRCLLPCSDKPGQHDFNLLKKLVLPDGSILRAKLPGRPTRDCLFSDPARDGIR